MAVRSLRAAASFLLFENILGGLGADSPQPGRLIYRSYQSTFQHPQHGGQIMAAPQHLAILCHHRVDALPCPRPWALFDPIKRMLGGAAKYRKHRQIMQAGNAVIAPFTASHHPPVKRQNRPQFASVKTDLLGQPVCRWKRCRGGHGQSLPAWPGKSSPPQTCPEITLQRPQPDHIPAGVFCEKHRVASNEDPVALLKCPPHPDGATGFPDTYHWPPTVG